MHEFPLSKDTARTRRGPLSISGTPATRAKDNRRQVDNTIHRNRDMVPEENASEAGATASSSQSSLAPPPPPPSLTTLLRREMFLRCAVVVVEHNLYFRKKGT